MRAASNILLVDDDPDIVDALTDALSDEGYSVGVAGDGLDALEYLERARTLPCVILLDWMMPRCNGEGFARRQRADPRFAAIPVVLLTADAQAHDKGEQIGAAASLKKPVALDELLEVVAKYCCKGG